MVLPQPPPPPSKEAYQILSAASDTSCHFPVGLVGAEPTLKVGSAGGVIGIGTASAFFPLNMPKNDCFGGDEDGVWEGVLAGDCVFLSKSRNS